MKTKTAVWLIAALMWAGTGSAPAEDAAKSDVLVWCGLDYSLVKMIGSEGFREADDIFPAKLDSWNALFMKELLPALEKKIPGLTTDTKAVQAANAKVTAACIVKEDGTRRETVEATHITDAQLAAAVKGYALKETGGLGLVFIVDRLVKAHKTSCFYVVFFDVGTRKIVRSERVCDEAGGIGFRNYWFNPFKKTVKRLPDTYQKVKGR